MIVTLKREEFRCKNCAEINNEYTDTFNTQLLQKEVDCLSREKQLLEKYVNELEFSNNMLKKQMHSDPIVSSSATRFLPHSLSSVPYSEAVKKKVITPAVLVIKSIYQNMGNAELEQEVKSKFRSGAMKFNVTGTKLIKDGILINCADKISAELERWP
ncbi:unnamed protein product [Acanthoscelides obtectus]|uniref:Uncharacterized protein n=1 Tax=Acanthoscelides obtectus TaxID=200917 RepID=A0A9P0LHZ6_ACAOB|nr:unnamed protein product [Acanthoscelides obtectus]CAK1641167.1 hypothetical protein AOBTE_LOCUS12208 [Acanthoscelides obtectus]